MSITIMLDRCVCVQCASCGPLAPKLVPAVLNKQCKVAVAIYINKVHATSFCQSERRETLLPIENVIKIIHMVSAQIIYSYASKKVATP